MIETYIISTHAPRPGQGENGLVTIVTPSGRVDTRGPVRPDFVKDFENNQYAVDLMRRMYPATGPILGDRLVFDSLALDGNKGRLRTWIVEVQSKKG